MQLFILTKATDDLMCLTLSEFAEANESSVKETQTLISVHSIHSSCTSAELGYTMPIETKLSMEPQVPTSSNTVFFGIPYFLKKKKSNRTLAFYKGKHQTSNTLIFKVTESLLC